MWKTITQEEENPLRVFFILMALEAHRVHWAAASAPENAVFNLRLIRNYLIIRGRLIERPRPKWQVGRRNFSDPFVLKMEFIYGATVSMIPTKSR